MYSPVLRYTVKIDDKQIIVNIDNAGTLLYSIGVYILARSRT